MTRRQTLRGGTLDEAIDALLETPRILLTPCKLIISGHMRLH